METILIVDDEKNYLLVLEALLGEEGYEVVTAQSATKALGIIEERELDLIVTDVKMPGISGLELLKELKKKELSPPVIMMTAFGTIEKAVEAIKEGAFDYITKPFDNQALKKTIAQALIMGRKTKEYRLVMQELQDKFGPTNLIGSSPAINQVKELIEKVAGTMATILITGESGTGKELVARAIHFNSPRRDKPLISVNCSALTETLLESELFGHEKGAFTGAIAQRKGRFELADGGTLFLDEVGEMSPSTQVTLLRVLQSKEFERVGGNKTIKVDVRLIAASNRDLKEEVDKGSFREDLYYRLNVVHIEVPPLRNRKEDIPLLLAHFLKNFSVEIKKEAPVLSNEALGDLMDYDWPGNIRELQNLVERAVILSAGSIIKSEDLPMGKRDLGDTELPIEKLIPAQAKLNEVLEMVEKKMITLALDRTDQVQAQAADLLGITRGALFYKMKRYKLS